MAEQVPRNDPPGDTLADHLRAAATAAMADVDALGLTGTDRAVALAVLLAARTGVWRGAASDAFATPALESAAPALNRAASAADAGHVSVEDLLGRIAARMKLPLEVVELVYDAREGAVGVVLSNRRLAEDKSGATRQLAQIVAGGRQAAGLEEWTSIGAVRPVVNEYGRLDSSNFAASIGKLDHVFLFRGKGLDRELKVTRGGMEIVADLVQALAGTAG